MSVLGWVSQEDESAEHVDIDTIDNVDTGDGVDEASSSYTVHNDKDEESGSDTDSDTNSEWDFNALPICGEDLASAGYDNPPNIPSFPIIENHMLGTESHSFSSINPISNEDSAISNTSNTTTTTTTTFHN